MTAAGDPAAPPGGPRHGQWLRGLGVVAATSFRADPWRAIATLVLTVVASVAGIFAALGLKLLTDAVIAGDAAGVTRAAVFLGGMAFVSVLSGLGHFNLDMRLRDTVGDLFDRRLIELSTAAPGVEHHERPDYVDEIELLRAERGTLKSAAAAAVNNLAMLARVGATVGLLASVDPRLMALPLFGVPSFFISAKVQRMYIAAQEQTAEPLRRARHLLEVATGAAGGKELRIFGASDAVIGRHRQVWRDADRVLDRTLVRASALDALGWACFALGFVGAIGLVGTRAVRGEATVGDVVLTLTLATQVNQLVTGAAQTIGWLLMVMRAVRRYLWLVDYTADAHAAFVPADPVPVPPALRDGIRFRDVSFRYPGTELDVLSHVDLYLPAGATVAVVGDNGAGKTTLVKLLCRFYEPSAGAIEVDGIDVRRFDPGVWRERSAAGFQDFVRFELLAQEAVGVGDLPQLDDPAAVRAALDRAGGAAVVDGLPAGLASQLGRSFDGGVELSGGEWQKLALGRAMMRADPLLLVLDEPTASLDAETEHALFERYAGAARRAASGRGAITVLVSHRFSTVLMADLIVVVAGGGVAETGTHAELMTRGGLYAELFSLQARGYS